MHWLRQLPSPSPSSGGEAPTSLRGLLTSPAVVTAVLTLIGSLVATVVGKIYVDGRMKHLGDVAMARLHAQAATELEMLRAAIARLGAEADARLRQHYDARSRQYVHVLPLLFQLRIAAQDAHDVLHAAVAGTAESVVFDRVYYLMAPVVWGRLIEQQLTDVDLSVSSEIAERYPYVAALRHVAAALPDAPSTMDDLINELTVASDAGPARCASLTDFRRRISASGDSLRVVALPLKLALLALQEPATEQRRLSWTRFDLLLLALAEAAAATGPELDDHGLWPGRTSTAAAVLAELGIVDHSVVAMAANGTDGAAETDPLSG